MKKILVYGMTGNIGGIENYIMYQYRQFDKSKLHLDFVNAYKNVKIAYYDEIRNNKSEIYDLWNRESWREFLIKHKNEYEAVIFNNTNPLELNMLDLIYDSRAFKRIIIHSHNGGFDQFSIFKNVLNKKLHEKQQEFKKIGAELWACSEFAGRWMFGNNSEFEIIKNGIDTNFFKYDHKVRQDVRNELGLLPDDFVIGNVARFSIQKNNLFLIDILSEILKFNQNAKLVLVGQNVPSFSMIKQLTEIKARLLGVSDKVFFLGLRKDTSRLYQAMDAFILPSLFEGLPVVGVEAQCSGLPCIFSDTITPEVKLLESTVYLPIKSGNAVAVWSNILNNFVNKTNQREKAFMKVREKGFDIQDETIRVQNLLLQDL